MTFHDRTVTAIVSWLKLILPLSSSTSPFQNIKVIPILAIQSLFLFSIPFQQQYLKSTKHLQNLIAIIKACSCFLLWRTPGQIPQKKISKPPCPQYNQNWIHISEHLHQLSFAHGKLLQVIHPNTVKWVQLQPGTKPSLAISPMLGEEVWDSPLPWASMGEWWHS